MIRSASPARWLLRGLGGLLLLSAGCVAPDVRSELAGAGFRSPTQTFETWRAAFIADLPDLEYRAFSADFTRRNGLSQLAYREARERYLRENAFLRRGIAGAKPVELRRLAEDRAVLFVRSSGLFHDVGIEVRLVREEFYELWREDRRIEDGFVAFEDAVLLDQGWVSAAVPMKDAGRFAELTEVRFGREWKIDDLLQVPVERLAALEPDPRPERSSADSPRSR